MVSIALDIGSTNIKCARLDTDALSAVEIARRPFPAALPMADGRFEVDADGLVKVCMGLLNAALDAHPQAQGIYLSVQMHGCVVTDPRDRPVTGYISWRDAACSAPAPGGGTLLDALSARLPQEAWQRTGMALKAKLSVAALFARLEAGLQLPKAARFHTLGGYLIRRLGGEYACHLTTAASTGLCDAASGAWSQEIRSAAGLDGLCFPEIRAGVTSVGVYRYRGRAYALYPDIGDHQACVLGSLARPDSDVNLNIGTGGMAGRIERGFRSGLECRPLLEGLYIRTITGLPNGRHVQALVDLMCDACRRLGGHVEAQAAWAAVCDPAFTRGVEDAAGLARFEGKDSLLIADFAAIGDSQRAVAMLYAAIAARCAEAVAALGDGVERLVFSGGALERNSALRNAIQKACGLPAGPIRGEAVMMGLLVVALLAQTGDTDLHAAYDRLERGCRGAVFEESPP